MLSTMPDFSDVVGGSSSTAPRPVAKLPVPTTVVQVRTGGFDDIIGTRTTVTTPPKTTKEALDNFAQNIERKWFITTGVVVGILLIWVAKR